jgi:hypothetical protein
LFPVEILKNYQSNYSAPTANSVRTSSNTNLESKTAEACRKIASAVIRSSNSKEEFIDFNQLKIPREFLIIGGVILAKSVLYFAYRQANKENIDIMDI